MALRRRGLWVVAAAIAAGTLSGCGQSGLLGESAAQIVRAGFRAGAAARSVHVFGTVHASDQTVSLNIDISKHGADGTVTVHQTRVEFVYLDGVEYERVRTGKEARVIGAVLAKGQRRDWIKLTQPTRDISSFSSPALLFRRFEAAASLSGLTNAGVVHVDGKRAVRVTQGSQGHLDVALGGAPLFIDMSGTGVEGSLRFDRWNEPLHVTVPRRWISLAAVRRRETAVHKTTVRNGTLRPSSVRDGKRLFRASGVGVEFEYPADFVPVKLNSGRDAGSRQTTETAVGIPGDVVLGANQYRGLTTPVDRQNATAILPELERLVDNLAKQRVGERTTTIDGHPLFSFAGFTYGTLTLRVFNFFFADNEVELQCQYAPAYREVGSQACAEMIRTLRVIGSGS